MEKIFELLDQETFYSRIVGHLSDVCYVLYSSDTQEHKSDLVTIESVLYKYEGRLGLVKAQIAELRNNCEHRWSFHGYGSSDRMVRCSKCLLIRPEGKT